MTNSQLPILRTAFQLVLVALVAQLCVTGAGAAIQTSSKSASSVAQTTKVDVNSADLETLETLPGVGPATAKRIVSGRPFNSLSDLEKVKGLSKAKVDELKDKVIFGPMASSHAEHSQKSSQANHKTTSSSNLGASSSAGGGAVTGSGSEHTAKASTSAGSTEKLAPGQQLNINTASATELEKLPGIGPTKAQAIVDYRTQNGNFKSIEDIEKVKGIKEGTFSKLKDYIKVD